MKWLREARERRKARERWRRQWQEEAERLAAYTSRELAEGLRRTKLSDRLPMNTEKLARDIAGLRDDDRYLLALVAEGRDRRYIAHHLFEAEKSVKLGIDRIVTQLGGRRIGQAFRAPLRSQGVAGGPQGEEEASSTRPSD